MHLFKISGRIYFFVALFIFGIIPQKNYSQESDSADNARLASMITLSEVVVRNNLNVARFIDQVKKDTSFYKAFRNLRIIEYSSLNEIRILDKKGNTKASHYSKTRQLREGGCRTMQVLEEKNSGTFYASDGSYKYMTAEMYAGLFFTKGKICGENNIVKGVSFSPRSQSGMARHKEQLKMLFFNPGKKIPGIPFIGDKIDIFDPDRAALYDFLINYDEYDGKSCYLFTIRAKENLSAGEKNKIVIDAMKTWFDVQTMEIMARSYEMSYDAGVYDFDVHMEVQMTKFNGLLLPKLLRYKGNWNVITKKRERAEFTATLYDFRTEQ
ncbi:MAG: hypothetical protein N2747_08630 [Chitinophagaceae bacterium]|nr:hypothetical protein [Chitinophagaceae bacterium]